ncbi:hypothetical protein QR680_003976 [Steinernema hermaphroditum]|uniref:CUB domain-containing protein n=1 Tax=Steinernema hermaphroditum TaxID=289476 RepID=A0AA39HNB3_9BILA|nr:hypothetical protein QR680_003976 [Steinernema hermaphroditum]
MPSRRLAILSLLCLFSTTASGSDFVESQCTSGVYLFDHKACHLLNNIPKIDESGQRNQMSFVKVTTEEDKKCEKSFTEVVNGMLHLCIVALILTTLQGVVSANIKFRECPKHSTESLSIAILHNGAAGIRSYDWPNSMTLPDGEPRFGNCGFKIKSASNQNVAIFFTSAQFQYHTSLLDGSVNTNNRSNVPTLPVTHRKVHFETRKPQYDVKTHYHWSGFEAIVGAYDNENMCPFESDAVVEVDDSAPRVIASQWYFDDDSATLPQRKCQWTFAPKSGYKLKIAFSVFIINATDESVRLYDDANPVFNLGGAEELPSRVFYTEKNFRIEYDRSARMSDPLSTRFLAVISAFSLDVKPETSEYCTANTTVTLTDDRTLTNYNVTQLLKPYGNSQECNFYVNSVPGKEVQFSVSTVDIEDCCDSLTIETPSATVNFSNPKNDDSNAVYSTVGAEVATIRWKSDGNYGRAGFRIHAEVLDCKCSGEKVINLNKNNSNVYISPSSTLYYCPGMDCQWTLSAPENTILILELNVYLRSQCFSNTNGFGDSLEIFDGTTTYKPQCVFDQPAPRPFYKKNLSINFESSDKRVTNQDENGHFDIKASYVDLVSLRSKNTVRFFNDSADSVLFRTSALVEQFSSVTFTLSKELSSKKLQLYPMSMDASLSFIDNVLIMDGDLSHVASSTSIYDLLYNTTVARPITSTTGSITLVLPYTSSIRHSGAMFLKVYDDSRDCSEANSVFNAPPDGDTFQTTYTAKSQNSKLLVCPLMILSLPGSFGDALNLRINSIQGTDKSVKVLPGTEHNVIPFYEVSRNNLSMFNNTSLYGDLFTILVPVGATIHFSIKMTTVVADRNVAGNTHSMGIFMTPNYPNGDASKQNIAERSLQIISLSSYDSQIDDRFKVKFDINGKLSSASSLDVHVDSKLFFRTANVDSVRLSFVSPYARQVTFRYKGPEGEKGFFVRYEVIPKPGDRPVIGSANDTAPTIAPKPNAAAVLSSAGTVVVIMAMFILVI